MDVNDRRPAKPSPRDEDYERPLTRRGITEANREFIQTGVQGRLGVDHGAAREIVRRVTKDRFTARRKGLEDFSSVGEYLEFLAQTGED